MSDAAEAEAEAETRPLLGNDSRQRSEDQNVLERGARDGSEKPSWRERTAEKLEAPSTHKTIVILIAIDASCVLADLTYTFLSPERDCSNPSPSSPSFSLAEDPTPIWLTILAHISLTINTLFLLEIPLALWCFGPQFYNPFPFPIGTGKQTPYARLHLFDALVVLSTFILEVVLRGREAELVGLLVLLRLWRLVKLVGGLAVGAGELQEELSNELAETERLLHEERARVQKLQDENARLRSMVDLTDVST